MSVERLKVALLDQIRHQLVSASTNKHLPSGVTRVGGTYPGRQLRVSPLYFFLKNLATFFSRQFYGVPCHPYFIVSWKTDDLFCSAMSLCWFHFTRVSLPGGCHPLLFYLSDLLLSTILCKFAHNFFIRVSPWRVSPGAVRPTRGGPPPPPSDATALAVHSAVVQLQLTQCSHVVLGLGKLVQYDIIFTRKLPGRNLNTVE